VEQIGVVGMDSGAFFAYFAAALEPGFVNVTFENLLYSYQNLVFTKFYNRERYNLKVMAWGILQHFDLVDLLPCLAHRHCAFVALRNAKGEPQSSDAFLNIALDHGYTPRDWWPYFQ
jgi:hypothetical protein